MLFPGSQHCPLCCFSLPIHASFLFSLFAKRATLGFPLPLRIQTFGLPPYSGLKAHINTNNWSPWSHFHDLWMVSMQSRDSCTFRFLKYPHTSSGFSQGTIFMLSDGPFLETSHAALFPRRSNWMWTQGHCFLRRTTARHRLRCFSRNCARIVFF